MIATARRRAAAYAAVAAMAPKYILAYSMWVWMELFVQVLALVIFVAFWRAVYADTATIAGLRLDQTLSYILLARVFAPLTYTSVISYFGNLLREGQMAIELLRPLDFQARTYVGGLAEALAALALQLPLVLVAVLFFGLRLPLDPLVWGCFALSALLGHTAVFFFDWALGCLAFQITEIWGLSMVRYGVGLFFSGLLIPLAMMPGWLRDLVSAVPLAQALYVPVSLLSGITPLAQAPRLLLTQALWLVGMGVASRLIFRAAVRKVTVQGG